MIRLAVIAFSILLVGCNQSVSKEISEAKEVHAAEIQKNETQKVKYFDNDFIKLAKNGEIKGVPVKIGTTIDKITNKYGQPHSIEQGEGSFVLAYDEVGFHYEAAMKENEQAPVTAIEFVVNEVTIQEMINDLGEPIWDGISEIDGLHTVLFEMGDYELWVKATDDHYLKTILLKKKF